MICCTLFTTYHLFSVPVQPEMHLSLCICFKKINSIFFHSFQLNLVDGYCPDEIEEKELQYFVP